MNVHVKPGPLKGELQVPGSKSHTIRSILLATLADGQTCIENPLASGDGLSALAAARAFGAIVQQEEHRWIVQGRGGDLVVPQNVVDRETREPPPACLLRWLLWSMAITS